MASPPELLANVPLFQELDPADLHRIAEATEVRNFDEGEFIFQAGEPGRFLFIVTAGTVQVVRPDRHAELQLAQFGPGEFFGEMALLNDSRRSATARAICEVDALVLEKESFRKLILERPDVALQILKVMSVRLRNANQQISGLSSQSVRDPLTGLLNRLAFSERLDEETARSRRYGGSFSLILIDLVDFSSVNTELGHDVGDLILAWVARLLNEHTRASDVPFRFEHDIFTVLCPWTAAGVADKVAMRLAMLVGEAKPPIEADVSLSLAAASATCPDHARESQPLYHHAQRALIAAKSNLTRRRRSPSQTS